jgi:hypothetical protein
LNLDALIDRAQELADRKDRDWDSRCRRWLNEGVREWSRKLPWPTLRRTEDFTFLSRDTTGRLLTLPQRVDKVLRVADDSNNLVLLPGNNPDKDLPEQHLNNTAGTAVMWREVGIAAVTRQPSVAAVLNMQTAQSDLFTAYVAGSALDTAASGTPDGIYQAHEEVSISSSGVHSTSALFVSIDTIGKNKESSNGDVVFSTAADGQLSRLYRDDYRARYRQLELTPAPSDGTVYQVEYLLLPQEMRDVNDMPPPAVDDSFLIWYCAGMIQRAQGNVQEAEVFIQRASQILDREASFEKNTGDQDFRAFPEPLYWSNEDQYTWPRD